MSQPSFPAELTPDLVAAVRPLELVSRLPDASITLAYIEPPLPNGGDKEGFTGLIELLRHVRRVLRDDGNLFFMRVGSSSLDVGLILGQLFPNSTSLEYVWPRRNNNIGASLPRQDTIFHYRLSEDSVYLPPLRPISQEVHNRYDLEDEHGEYMLVSLFTTRERPDLRYELDGYLPPDGWFWRYRREKMEDLVSDGRVYFPPTGPPRLKRYLKDRAADPAGLVWDDIPHRVPSRTSGIPVQQPTALLERIINMGSQVGDTILIPYMWAGSAVIAASRLNRRWLSCPTPSFPWDQVLDRVTAELQSEDKSYRTLDASSLTKIQRQTVSSSEVATHAKRVNEIRIERDTSQQEMKRLRAEVSRLEMLFTSVRKHLGVEGEVEEVIAALEGATDQFLASTNPQTLDVYIKSVRDWLTKWERLEEATQTFLPSGELILDLLPDAEDTDYSPFIIQYCRGLENEILQKLFTSYTHRFLNDHGSNSSLLEEHLGDDNLETKLDLFTRKLRHCKLDYTLGHMSFIIGLMKPGGRTLGRSRLLQDFERFIDEYFDPRVRDKSFRHQIRRICQDYRNKAAHPYILELQVARQCQKEVRKCLNDFLLSYQGPEALQ